MITPIANTTPTIDVQPDQWRIVRDILQKHVPGHAVWAFGSRATGTAKPFSDLDVVVITERPLSLDLCAHLGEDFSQSMLPWKVDVVDWATASDVFRAIINRDKVVIQQPLAQHTAPEPDRESNREMP